MFWHISDEDLESAQRGDAGAAQRLFQQATATCGRVATTLLGTHAQGHRAVRELAKRAATQLPGWRSADEAARWFMHHTILLTRQLRKPFDPQYDVLLHDVGGPDVTEYRAMVTALRKLPEQQQEAFLLTHAQKWNTRLCAVAMDCSNVAVETHLVGATRELQPLLGKHFEVLMGFLRQVHEAVPVETTAIATGVARRTRARRSAKLLTTIFGWAFIALIVLFAVWVAIYIIPKIET